MRAQGESPGPVSPRNVKWPNLPPTALWGSCSFPCDLRGPFLGDLVLAHVKNQQDKVPAGSDYTVMSLGNGENQGDVGEGATGYRWRVLSPLRAAET